MALKVSLVVGLLLAFACARASERATISSAAPDTSALTVDGPTIVAFYPVIDSATADTSENLATAMDDLSYHLAAATKPLEALGFRVVMRRVDSLRFNEGGRVVTYRPPKDRVDIGYYLVAPGRAPKVFFGVETYAGLVEDAKAYLAQPKP